METHSTLLADRHPRITLARPHGQPLVDYDDGRAMARVVVDAIREPVLLLDRRLRVVAANRAYCLAFKAERKDVQGRPVRAISDGRWDTPEVRAMLGRIRERSFSADFHEMEQDVPGAGRRTLILHASGGVDEAQARRLLLLSIEDVSDRRAAERESGKVAPADGDTVAGKPAPDRQQPADRREHPPPQSAVGSVAGDPHPPRERPLSDHVGSDGSATAPRHEGCRADRARALSGAALRDAGCLDGGGEPIGLDCLRVDGGTVSATDAVSVGLIVTELVINALKHAFVDDRAAGRIVVTYDLSGDAWCLAVSDNGIGRRAQAATPGLGTGIIGALVSQLDSRLEVATGPNGTTVSISHRRD